MLRNFRHRLITVLLALTSLLFSQLAVAAYVCPGIGSNVAQASMPCADAMATATDESQPNLCRAHCQAGQQKADTYQPPVLASLPRSGADYLATQILSEPPGASLQTPHLRRITAPSLAIRNCCFRI